MNTSESDQIEDHWTLLESLAPSTSERTQRKIACAFSRLVWNELPEEGKEALLVAEKYSERKIGLEICVRHQEILRSLLPSDGASLPVSPVIWSLQESTAGYPAWYSASIAGANVIDLKAATNEELCAIIKQLVSENPDT